MTAASIAAVVLYFPSGEKFFKFHFGFVNYVVIGIAAVIAIYLIYEGLRHRRYAAPLFAFVQVAALAVFELIQGTGIKVEHNLYVDRFSMILMIFHINYRRFDLLLRKIGIWTGSIRNIQN